MIHPTAIVHPGARLDPTVCVGPYAVIEEHVVLGPRCLVGPYVHLAGRTEAGADNRFATGCVIGEAPQDLKYRNDPSALRIGDGNVFREHVTVHRANHPEHDTVIGSNNFLMGHCHIGHDCELGNRVIVANGALLAGHVTVQDRAFISGNCLIHQFVRVGTLAMMQGGAAISKDLPPYTVARGDNGICGLNTVGLRRAGFPTEQRLALRRLYHLLFRNRRAWRVRLAEARRMFEDPASVVLLDFVAQSKRGLCHDSGRGSDDEA